MGRLKLEELPVQQALAEIRRRAIKKRWERLDKFLKKEYGSDRISSEQLSEVSDKVMLELAVFGEDEKIRLLAAQSIKGKGGGRLLDDKNGVLEKIRQDLAGSS